MIHSASSFNQLADGPSKPDGQCFAKISENKTVLVITVVVSPTLMRYEIRPSIFSSDLARTTPCFRSVGVRGSSRLYLRSCTMGASRYDSFRFVFSRVRVTS